MPTTQLKSNQCRTHQLPMQSPSLPAAWQLRSQGDWKNAADTCRSILASTPGCGEAWHLLGLLANDQGHGFQAIQHLKQAITVEPRQPAHYSNLGFVLISMKRYEQAASFLLKALGIAPHFHDARCNLGLALYHQNHLTGAAQCFVDILSDVADHHAALANLGMTRLAQQMYAQAADAYEKAVAISPGRAQWHGNLGAAYIRMGQYDKSAECYRRASELDATTAVYEIHRSIALRAAGNLPESIRLLEGVLSKDATNEANRSLAIAHLVVGLEYTCQWDKLDLFYPMLAQATRDALATGCRPDEDPMLNIRRCDDVRVNRAVGRAWSLRYQNNPRPGETERIHIPSGRHRRKITLGYLSYDFRNHPVAHQLFPLFGMHDRNRFRTIAFSMGPDDDSFFRNTIVDGCDDFIDISAQGLAEAAHTIRQMQIDILVDLMGHSHHNRMGILALRPAPIQVGYLGFLSTTGAQFIDYLVADAQVIPKDHEPYYDEKLLRMPYCYQFSHTGLIGGQTEARREDWGLPAAGFVFCCFNTVYKIDRELFDTWMRILLRVPGSVLWLNGGHPMARHHMRSRARRLGIDPCRLVFCEKIPLEDHLRRIPLSDLALDTVRYTGGATTANAIGAGVPVLTVMGRHWVSRMSASQLMAVGLPDLVFSSICAYEHAAIELARDESKLAMVQQRLKQNRTTHPLFDCQGFVHQLETGYEIIWQRFMDGLAPDHVDIPQTPLGAANE
jgi:protein O-GlcNAc transferase